MQPLLGAAVAALDARLRRERAAVVLEVQLADDDRPRAAARPRARRRTRPATRCACAAAPAGRARAAERLEHLARRPAAAVAVPEDEQARPRVLGVAVLARRPQQLARRRPRCCTCRPAGSGRAPRCRRSPCQTNVCWSGRLNRFHESFCVKKRVIPAAAHQLRQLAVVAERVRRPELRAPRRRTRCSKKRCPCRSCRTSDSPRRQVAGRARSSCRRRARTARRRPSRGCAPTDRGSRSSIHAYCCACEHAKRYSGYSSM